MEEVKEPTSPKEEKEESRKVDISKLIALIPPASELKKEEKKPVEKRIRIRFDRSLDKPIAKIPAIIASELGIKDGDPVEVVIAGKKKALFTAKVIEGSEHCVLVYPGELEKQGVADNSIATIRRAKT